MRKRKYPLNENVFDTLTSRSAYWIGFLFGDGSCTNENKVRLTLSERDSDVLYKFRSFLGCDTKPLRYRVINGKNYVGLEVRSWRFIDKLSAYECTLTKDKRGAINPALLTEVNARDFIRGLFDADGSFYYDGQHKNNLFAEITGYLPAMKSLKQALEYYGVITEKKKIVRNGKIYRIRFPKDACIRLIKFLYQDAKPEYCLDRKYGLAKSYLDRLNVESQKVSNSRKYFRPRSQFNKGKKSEFDERVWFKEDKENKDGQRDSIE